MTKTFDRRAFLKGTTALAAVAPFAGLLGPSLVTVVEYGCPATSGRCLDAARLQELGEHIHFGPIGRGGEALIAGDDQLDRTVDDLRRERHQ